MSNGETQEVAATEETTETKTDAEEVIDIDLNDPQTEEAAVKIQVSYSTLSGHEAHLGHTIWTLELCSGNHLRPSG